MVQMNWTGAAIESGPPPIPQLEREDVWCRADLQDHAVRSRTMEGTGRDEKVVMLTLRPFVHIVHCLKPNTILLCTTQVIDHSLGINDDFQSKVDACVRRGIQQE